MNQYFNDRNLIKYLIPYKSYFIGSQSFFPLVLLWSYFPDSWTLFVHVYSFMILFHPRNNVDILIQIFIMLRHTFQDGGMSFLFSSNCFHIFWACFKVFPYKFHKFSKFSIGNLHIYCYYKLIFKSLYI